MHHSRTQVAASAIILSHWGRVDAEPHTSTRYMADNWEQDNRGDTRAPDGTRWRFPGGSRAMIGRHACHDPRKDLVIPVFSPPYQWEATPWLSGRQPPRGRLKVPPALVEDSAPSARQVAPRAQTASAHPRA